MTNFDFSQLDRLVKRLEKAPPKMERATIQVSHNSAKKMVADAKRNHPWQNRRGFLERDLRVIRKGRFGKHLFGASWGVDSPRRGKVGAILEATGWEFIGPATERWELQWVKRLVEAAVKSMGFRVG